MRRAPTHPGSTLPRALLFFQPGCSFFSTEFLQSLDHQHLLGDHLLELGVFDLKNLQLQDLRLIEAAILVAPSIEGHIGDVVAPADLSDADPRNLSLSEDLDDPFFAEPLLLHLSSSAGLTYHEDLQIEWSQNT